MAEGVLLHPRLPGELGELLRASHSAYLLGSTAPDLCSLTGEPREATHFFEIPMSDRTPAHLQLLKSHPELVGSAELRHNQAAFLAGYLSHLWLDQAWIAAIFEPFFGPDVRRGGFQERLTEHNVLRTRLDREAHRTLRPDIGEVLGECDTDRWIPCLSEDLLRRWRDHLATQLRPGGRLQTVNVFAERARIPAEEFSSRLASAESGDPAAYFPLPCDRLAAYRRLALAGCLELVNAYLQGGLDAAPITSRPFRKRIILHHEKAQELL